MFKTASPTRSSVLGKDIDLSLPAEIQVDDYVCLVSGTCVPELPEAYQDYLIQFGVLELRRRHAEMSQEELQALKDHEQELLKAWAGREQSHRIRRASIHWGNGSFSRRKRLLS